MPGGPMRGDTLRTRHDLAWTIGRQGNWADAEEQFRDVLRRRRERRRRRGGHGDDPDILHTRCMLCWSVGKQGRWAEAERDYRQLTADRAGVLGLYHPDTLDTRENIGKALAWQDRWAEAEREWDQLTALRSAALGEKNPDTLRARQLAAYAAGRLAREDGNRADRRRAIAVLREILDAQIDVRGDDHRETRETRALLADLEGKPRTESEWPEDLPHPTPSWQPSWQQIPEMTANSSLSSPRGCLSPNGYARSARTEAPCARAYCHDPCRVLPFGSDCAFSSLQAIMISMRCLCRRRREEYQMVMLPVRGFRPVS
jgi:hypothetical protein